uniref:Uncharacterized protein n=1 Tax=Mycobacterium riyadhense TaxID=486698 RepID=A0A653EI73_9MYCO|nr:hypothetical protein BIN_B_01896 [Mycobacterium riyadhense]
MKVDVDWDLCESNGVPRRRMQTFKIFAWRPAHQGASR